MRRPPTVVAVELCAMSVCPFSLRLNQQHTCWPLALLQFSCGVLFYFPSARSRLLIGSPTPGKCSQLQCVFVQLAWKERNVRIFHAKAATLQELQTAIMREANKWQAATMGGSAVVIAAEVCPLNG